MLFFLCDSLMLRATSSEVIPLCRVDPVLLSPLFKHSHFTNLLSCSKNLSCFYFHDVSVNILRKHHVHQFRIILFSSPAIPFGYFSLLSERTKRMTVVTKRSYIARNVTTATFQRNYVMILDLIPNICATITAHRAKDILSLHLLRYFSTLILAHDCTFLIVYYSQSCT